MITSSSLNSVEMLLLKSSLQVSGTYSEAIDCSGVVACSGETDCSDVHAVCREVLGACSNCAGTIIGLVQASSGFE